MNDRYLAFANSALGSKLTKSLGLPQPVPLLRHRPGVPDVRGPVLIGAAPGGRFSPSLARILRAADAATLYHAGHSAWMAEANRAGLMTGRFSALTSGRVGAAVFDASGIQHPAGLAALYHFLHESARSIEQNGRVVLLGVPPELAQSTAEAAAQRALEGIARALGKEIRRAITVQLLLIAPGAEDALDTTLRFFLSPRSAYVSGQVVRISPPVGEAAEFDAVQPQHGRRALVTGAARGIGAAIAEVLAREGATIILLDTPESAAELETLATRLGGHAITADIAAPDAAALVVRTARAHGGLDVVVHNAGITRDKTIGRMDATQWSSVIAVNLEAPLQITEALLSEGGLNERGDVVCVSSIAAIAGNPGQTNYAASKAGLIGLVQHLAPHFAARGGTINAVAPGFIETRMTARMPFAIREAGRRMNAMGQGGQPIDVAEAVAWLAHPGSGGINGAVVRVCGQSILGA